MPHLRLLGGAILEDDDGVVDGAAARPQPLALLALLATAPAGTRSRSKIVGFLWRDATERQARNRLNTCVHRVRGGLGEEVLLSVGDDLRLNREALSCDVARFEEALEVGDPARAVELYQGPFLDGFGLRDAPGFEKWTDRERDRLAQEYRGALETLAGEAEDRGEPATAARWWRERVRSDPYDSRAVRRLMEALVTSDNPAEALRVARVHARLLEEELGTDPGAGVRELAERIEEGEGEVAGPAASPTEPAAADEPGTVEEEEESGGASDAAPEQGPGAATGRREQASSRSRLAAAGLLLAAVLAGAWFLWSSGGDTAPTAGDRSIAVLPFEAVGTDDPDPIAEGLHNDLLTRLSQVSGLHVISATSVERYRDRNLALPVIADSLGVTWVLEGDVQRAGDEIRVNAQLVDPRTDTHAWAETYQRELTAENLFALQTELAGRIARALETELTPEERKRFERRPTADLEAYRLYARGRGLLVRRTDSALNGAEELFRRAIQRDSTFAPAWAGLAKSLVLYPQARGRNPDSVFPPGRHAAQRALELDPELAEAHLALAIVDYYRMRGPSALLRNRRALELDPSSGLAHHGLNLLHLVFGRPQEAIKHAQRAAALDPMSPERQQGLALAHLASGDPERGLRAARRAREIEPGYGGPMMEAYALYRLGRLSEADTTMAKPVRDLMAALANATAGDTVPARELLSRLEEEPHRISGLLHAGLGHRSEALETFETVFRRKDMSGGGLTIMLRHYYPDVLGPLRGTPGWRALIREINIGWGLDPDGSLPDSVDARYVRGNGLRTHESPSRAHAGSGVEPSGSGRSALGRVDGSD